MEKIKITQALGLKMTSGEFSHTDRNVQLSAIFTQWLPLADAVLKMVSAHLPSPLGLSEERVERLMTGNSSQRNYMCSTHNMTPVTQERLLI